MVNQTEQKLQRSLLNYIKRNQLNIWRENCGKVCVDKVRKHFIQLAPIGTPDLIGYAKDGKFIGVEVKTGTYQRSKPQKEWAAKAQACGIHYSVVRSLEQFKQFLLEIGEVE